MARLTKEQREMREAFERAVAAEALSPHVFEKFVEYERDSKRLAKIEGEESETISRLVKERDGLKKKVEDLQENEDVVLAREMAVEGRESAVENREARLAIKEATLDARQEALDWMREFATDVVRAPVVRRVVDRDVPFVHFQDDGYGMQTHRELAHDTVEEKTE